MVQVQFWESTPPAVPLVTFVFSSELLRTRCDSRARYGYRSLLIQVAYVRSCRSSRAGSEVHQAHLFAHTEVTTALARRSEAVQVAPVLTQNAFQHAHGLANARLRKCVNQLKGTRSPRAASKRFPYMVG